MPAPGLTTARRVDDTQSALFAPMNAPQASRRRERGLDLVKWLALLSMAIDHLRFLIPDHPLLAWSFVPGRLAFPLFCLALAVNLARSRPGVFGRSEQRYIGALLLFAVLSEPAHDLMLGNAHKLNILITLALGWGVAWCANTLQRGPLLLAGLMLAGAGWLSANLTYGMLGVLLPTLCLLALQRGGPWPALATLVVLLANLTPRLGAALLAGQPRDWLIAASCLAALPLGFWLLRTPLAERLRVPPVGRWAYFFYPLHMLAIAAAAWLLRMP
ncbi:TraX protein [Pseudomonas linyingensis]|uniref:TraX protein n=2 Tax=Pseudomonas linyingensis TaxID=915471 RepID=A0A1H7C5X4_9PSED|nr:TraX protein [Pseudomonas linyingensis]